MTAQEVAVFSPELKKGSVEMLILALIEERARHGYEIAKMIEARSDGRLSFRVSSLYPILYRLEDQSLIAGRWVEKPGERRRCFYRLTAAGRTVLTEKRETWTAFAAAIEQVLGHA